MKKLLIFAALGCLQSSCYIGGIPGSGKIVTEKRNLSGFTAISSAASVEVEFTQGNEFAVEAEADDNLIRHLKTVVEGGKLKIYIGDNVSVRNAHFKVTVTAPEINSLKASSSSSIHVNGTLKSASQILLAASSSASIEADVDAPVINADASSSADINLSGKTKDLTVEASSSAEINAFGLLSENTRANANSSGTANVFASIDLDAHASSSGDINYKGGARVKVATNSSGSVNKSE
jgi:hypothetical protein